MLMGKVVIRILVAFARSHDDLFHSEVNVLDPEAYCLHESQAAGIKQLAKLFIRAVLEDTHFCVLSPLAPLGERGSG